LVGLIEFVVSTDGAERFTYLGGVVSGIINLAAFVASLILWFFPMTFAKKLLSTEVELPLKAITPNLFIVVTIASLGLLFLYLSISDTIYWFTYWIMLPENVSLTYSADILNENKSATIATGFELVFAFVLITKRKSIAYWLVR